MQKIILLVSFFSILTSTSLGQLRRSHSDVMGSLKDSRKQLELQTELSILEKLEAMRLEDERNRRLRFDALNFSVVPAVSTSGF